MLGSLTPRSHQDVETAPENEENPHQFTLHLHRIFEEEHLYLNPKLTIMDLAQAIGTNRTYISNYLNKVLGTTFFDYVNQYRLSYAEQLLRQTKMSIEEIADRSGFNSRSTFRRAFLKRSRLHPEPLPPSALTKKRNRKGNKPDTVTPFKKIANFAPY